MITNEIIKALEYDARVGAYSLAIPSLTIAHIQELKAEEQKRFAQGCALQATLDEERAMREELREEIEELERARTNQSHTITRLCGEVNKLKRELAEANETIEMQHADAVSDQHAEYLYQALREVITERDQLKRDLGFANDLCRVSMDARESALNNFTSVTQRLTEQRDEALQVLADLRKNWPLDAVEEDCECADCEFIRPVEAAARIEELAQEIAGLKQVMLAAYDEINEHLF